MRGKTRQKARRLNVWSRRGYAALDQRLVEAREEKRLIAELSRHVGGSPSPPQQLLIQRCARAMIMLGQLERKIIEKGDLSDIGARQVVALSNSVRLNLQAIGIERPQQMPGKLADVIKVRAA